MKVLMIIDKGVAKASRIVSSIGGVVILCMMIIVVANVLGRALFDAPIAGTAELAKNGILLTAMCMLPWALVEGRHVRSTIIIGKVPTKVKTVLNMLAYLAGIFVFFLIFWSGMEKLISSMATGEIEQGGMVIVTWPMRLGVVLGSLLSLWHCIIAEIDILTSGKYFDTYTYKDETAAPPDGIEPRKEDIL